ncbi:hypothetical protein DCAR_0205289 [Daucus carota subsp. sativus]|uniref:Uncharacterized protein n=1 Tax=Daucus carota subsp. sativus TaxID=79200 RepID=A0AAF0WAY5_DAUCS|nr:hypothetical protein DCAR_0205289 [Daucus carota subsp. sativus]
MHEKLEDDAALLPLWPRCVKVSKLSAVLTLYNLKVGHQVSDVFFTEMLTAVSELLPDGNVLPRRAYEAKQMLKSIGLVHDRIHSCPNDCILYKNMQLAFNGEVEERGAPPQLSGEEVLREAENRSIFFELSYWKDLYVTYFIDLMHVEKNVFDNIIGTLLSIRRKTKDGIKARMDMMDMGIRSELAPVEKSGKTLFTSSCTYSVKG